MIRHDVAPPTSAGPPYYGYGYGPAQDEPVDARALTKIVRRHRRLIGGTIVAISGMATLLAFNLTPQFTGVASVTIDPQATRVVNTEAILEERPQDRWTIETHLALIKSRSFARRLIEEHDLLADPEFNSALRPVEEPGPIAQQVQRLTRWLSDSVLSTTGLAMSSPTEAAPARDDLLVMEDAIDRVLGRLDAARAGESYAISVYFTSTDPVKAAQIANHVAQLYVEEQLRAKQEAAARAAEWLGERITELRGKLLESENAIAVYKADNELIDSQEGVTLNSARLTALHSQLIEARAQRADKESKLGVLRQVRNAGVGFESVNEIISSPVIAHLKTLQTDLLRQEAQLRQEYGPRHPKIVTLIAEKQKLDDKIYSEVQNIINAFESEVSFLRNREQALQDSLEQAKQTVALGQRAAVQLSELQRDAESNRVLYQALLDRYKKLTEQRETIEAGAEVISTAPVPNGPSFPQPKLIIAVGFTGSLVVAGLLALVTESLQSGLRSTRQIERTLGVSCLSHVPLVKFKGDCSPALYPVRKPRSAYAEAVRAVHINLQFAQLDRPPRVVLVTSSLPGEGKTSLAISLAASAAASGHKTLIVDLDLRHPSVRPASGQPLGTPGIVELVTGSATLEEVVHTDPELPNLDMITVRRNPINPSDVLASKQMGQLIAKLRTKYKFVILDTPPVLGITDAKLVMHMADAVLFVVRWGKTKTEVAENGIAALRDCRAPIAGAVLTQVDMEAHAKGAYGDAATYYGNYKKYYLD
jgi:capsular exopolysaccharide synthesis family protein